MDFLFKKIFPYYQPILAIDTGEIYSYEVLGRYIEDDGSVKSLGDYFSNKNVSSEDALEVDKIVRKMAIEQYAKENCTQYIFINFRLEWIAEYADKLEELPTILWAKEFGVDTGKIVIEITEEEFNSDSNILTRVFSHYRRAGCRIAIDDYGKQASNLDRLAMLSPDIIKINIDYIHKSEHSLHYREYLNMLSLFAGRVGIEILYEGIETQKQLDLCIDSNGKYYQGFLISLPQPSMINSVVNYDIFKSSSFRSIMELHDKVERINTQRKFWDLNVERFFTKNRFNIFLDDFNDYFSKLFLEISEMAKRIYLCNRRGEQLSYNIEIECGKVVWNDFRRRNWAWRGFFQEAMIMLDTGMKSHLSESYLDANTKDEIYTYAYAINTDLYLFIDIYYLKAIEKITNFGKENRYL